MRLENWRQDKSAATLPLPQLADPESYRPCDWDLRADREGLAYWHGLFRWHLDRVLLPLIDEEYRPLIGLRRRFRNDYLAAFDALRDHADRYPQVDILWFTELRREVMARYGFDDPFQAIKQRENQTALGLLPGLLAELDQAGRSAQEELLVRGLMAGNLFDLGAVATVERHCNGQLAFAQARAAQPSRPWLHDDVESWWRRWRVGQPYRHAVFFVDNAGSDLVLGCLPLARWMAEAGTVVTLAANSGPSLNDITATELETLLRQSAELDARLKAACADGRLRVAATGMQLPLLDLSRLSEPLVREAGDVDLIIVHGMGRAIESNFGAALACDGLWTAVLKDEAVAARVGGKLFDCVFRFRPAQRGGGRLRSYQP